MALSFTLCALRLTTKYYSLTTNDYMISILISNDFTEWVRAPTEIKSTPV